MGVTSCRFRRVAEGGYSSKNIGRYKVEYSFHADRLMGIRTAINGCLAGTLPAFGPDGTTENHPIPNHGDSYNYEDLLGPGEREDTSFAYDFDVKFRSEDRKSGIIVVSFSPLDAGETLRSRQAYVDVPRGSIDPGGTPLGLEPIILPFPLQPEQRGASWYFDEEAYSRVVTTDINGEPLKNSAGVTFDRTFTMEDTRGLLIAEFGVQDLRQAIALNRTYSNAVNSTFWTLFNGTGFTTPEARTVACRYARVGRAVYEGTYAYYPMSMAFAFAEPGKTWDANLVNEGYSHLDGPSGELVDAEDNNGKPVREPVLLAPDGTRLPQGQLGNSLFFRVRREVNFNNLNTLLRGS